GLYLGNLGAQLCTQSLRHKRGSGACFDPFWPGSVQWRGRSRLRDRQAAAGGYQTSRAVARVRNTQARNGCFQGEVANSLRNSSNKTEGHTWQTKEQFGFTARSGVLAPHFASPLFPMIRTQTQPRVCARFMKYSKSGHSSRVWA